MGLHVLLIVKSYFAGMRWSRFHLISQRISSSTSRPHCTAGGVTINDSQKTSYEHTPGLTFNDNAMALVIAPCSE